MTIVASFLPVDFFLAMFLNRLFIDDPWVRLLVAEEGSRCDLVAWC